MKEANKNIFFIFGAVVIIGVLFIFAKQIFSYDTDVAHPLLAEKSITLFNNQAIANKLSAEQAGWIIRGAVDEDIPYRWMNHFYDPTIGYGLTGFAPANIWANSGLAQSTYLIGDQSWQTAISAYNNNDKKRAFMALGHVLHLVEDMAVPAHTRIDTHLEGDPFENWVKLNAGQKLNIANQVIFNNLNDYFNNLAVYSNKYFFSKDTIVKNNLDKLKTELILDNNKILSCFIFYDEDKNKYCLVAGDINFVNPSKSIYRLTDKNHSDYHSLLAPKAIAYGAGIIDLFFKEAEAEKNKKLTLAEKLKQAFLKVSGVLITGFSNLFGAYQTTVTNYADTLSANNVANQAGQVLSAFEQAGSGENIFKSTPTKAEDEPAANANPLNPPLEGGQKIHLPAQTSSIPNTSGGRMPTNPLNPPLEGGQKIHLPAQTSSIPNTSGGRMPTNPLNPPLEGGQPQPITVQPVSLAPTFIFVAGDSTSPETSITSGPSQLTNLNSAVFIFTASEVNSTFDCNLNNASWQGCSSPKNLTNLADGSHIFKVRARDSSNNLDQTPAEHSWIIDMAAPIITINSSPAALASSTSADFVFSADQAVSIINCDLDANGWPACVSPVNYENLSAGAHNFKVKARDLAGNETAVPAEFSWIIDLTAPQITITSGPPDIASSTTANFQFSSSESETAYQCRLDANAWQACSASTTAASLVEGNHSLEVKGADQAGNVGSSTVKTWLLDLTAATSTMAGLDASYETTGFTVAWSGTDMDAAGATTTASGLADFDVEYKIESGDWQNWISATTSTSTIFNLAVASGQTIYFQVRARDLAGNLGEWSAAGQTEIDDYLADHVVISEFASRGPIGAFDEFAELYNPTGEDVNLSGWKLQTKSAGGISWINRTGLSGLPAGIIRARGYYLITASDYSLSAAPDYRHSANWGLADGGGHIRIVNDLEEEIDKVGYGGAIDPEGSALAADLSDGKSLERKAAGASTAESMAAGGAQAVSGNSYDSDNNGNDFILRTSPKPQNSNSPSESINSTPDLTAPVSSVAALNEFYQFTGFAVSWSGEDFDDVGATTTASGLENYDLQYKIDAGAWQNWVNATTSTSTIFNIAVADGQTVYFRSRARDYAGNLESWLADENGDTGTMVDSVVIFYDVVRDNVLAASNFGRDYIVTNFQPTASSISGISIKTTVNNANDGSNYTITLCKGTLTADNLTTKINCGSDILIAQKTCTTNSGVNIWQNCSFNNSFHITPSDEYYVVLGDSTWLASTWGVTDYGSLIACGFQSDGSELYCFNNTLNKAFLTLRTYYDKTISY